MTEGVRSDEGDTRNGRMKGGSETVDEQVEKKGGKNSALRNNSVDPGWRDSATKTDLGQGATQEVRK